MNQKKVQSRLAPVGIEKVSSGVAGFDEVLTGGFPKGRTTLIKGRAGTGKTVLGLEFLYRGAMEGEPAIFISFEESAEAIRANALSMGWDLAALEASGTFFLWEARIDFNAVISGQFTLDSLLAIIGGKAREMGARRIMIDALDVMLSIFEDPVRERSQLRALHGWVVEQQFTAILTAKGGQTHRGRTHEYESLDYMSDCVIFLDARVNEQVTTRRLRVVKYRGSGFCSNEYPYVITPNGSTIMPITTVHLQHPPFGERMSSGHDTFDKMLGGGYFRGSTILISGLTGSGKTTLAAVFSKGACGRREKVLYVSFEESQEAIITAMRSPGIGLQQCVDEGLLDFWTIMPEALVPEEHLFRLLQRIEAFKPDHVIIDAVSAVQRMNTEQAAFDFLVRFVDACKDRQITCMMTNQLNSNHWQEDISGIGMSSIIDTVVVLSLAEVRGEMQRSVIVIKSRGTRHSHRRHTYAITDDGVRITWGGADKGRD